MFVWMCIHQRVRTKKEKLRRKRRKLRRRALKRRERDIRRQESMRVFSGTADDWDPPMDTAEEVSSHWMAESLLICGDDKYNTDKNRTSDMMKVNVVN